jgi:hypothetical protein
MSFRKQTVTKNSSRIILDRTSVTRTLPELEYLVLNLNPLPSQLARYRLAESDVSAYVQSATGTTASKESACLFVQYDVLFEEINGYL